MAPDALSVGAAPEDKSEFSVEAELSNVGVLLVVPLSPEVVELAEKSGETVEFPPEFELSVLVEPVSAGKLSHEDLTFCHSPFSSQVQ